MVRLSIAPGPLEGADVYDVRNRHVGVVEDIVVSGEHITAFNVALDAQVAKRRNAPDHVQVARDWLTSTDGVRIDLAVSLEELLRDAPRGR